MFKDFKTILGLSFGGLNGFGILTCAISLTNLLRKHGGFDLKGVVANALDYYEKFFHNSIDATVLWLCEMANWQPFHIADWLKDTSLILFLVVMVTIRGTRTLLRVGYSDLALQMGDLANQYQTADKLEEKYENMRQFKAVGDRMTLFFFLSFALQIISVALLITTFVVLGAYS